MKNARKGESGKERESRRGRAGDGEQEMEREQERVG